MLVWTALSDCGYTIHMLYYADFQTVSNCESVGETDGVRVQADFRCFTASCHTIRQRILTRTSSYTDRQPTSDAVHSFTHSVSQAISQSPVKSDYSQCQACNMSLVCLAMKNRWLLCPSSRYTQSPNHTLSNSSTLLSPSFLSILAFSQLVSHLPLEHENVLWSIQCYPKVQPVTSVADFRPISVTSCIFVFSSSLYCRCRIRNILAAYNYCTGWLQMKAPAEKVW